MIKSVAIYPHHINDEYKEKVRRTIELAALYGFNEVFTTIHLPEYSLDEQLQAYILIFNEVKAHGLKLTVDIGGRFIGEVLSNQKYLHVLKECVPDFIRLDYGFDADQVEKMYSELHPAGFVINASIYNEDEVDRIVEAFRELDSHLELRACHNYYPKEETGIDDCFALRQDSYFEKYNIPVYYCIASCENARGPLYSGLCTIECQRRLPEDLAIASLYVNHGLSAFMLADEWLNEAEFETVKNTLEVLTEELDCLQEIEVQFAKGVSEEERKIVLKEHQFRFDSSFWFLRSQTSRQMAELSEKIIPNNCTERKTGDITIDNELYKRYSGEMAVVMKPSSIDRRVNNVGRIVKRSDILKLLRFREGIRYKFVEQR